MKALLLLALALLLVAPGCGGGDKSYGSGCSSGGDCKSGFVCPGTGPMSGRCTKSCTKDEDCAAIGGGVCSSDVCVPK